MVLVNSASTIERLLYVAIIVYYTDVLLPLLSGNVATTQANWTGHVGNDSMNGMGSVHIATSFAEQLLDPL